LEGRIAEPNTRWIKWFEHPVFVGLIHLPMISSPPTGNAFPVLYERRMKGHPKWLSHLQPPKAHRQRRAPALRNPVRKSRVPLAQPRPQQKSRQRGNRLEAPQKNLRLNDLSCLAGFHVKGRRSYRPFFVRRDRIVFEPLGGQICQDMVSAGAARRSKRIFRRLRERVRGACGQYGEERR
jgi:hypothetical protein